MSVVPVQHNQNQNGEKSEEQNSGCDVVLCWCETFICLAFAPDLEVDHTNLQLSICRQ